MPEGHDTSSPSKSTAKRSRLFDAEPDALLIEEWVPIIVLPEPPVGQALPLSPEVPANPLSIDGDVDDSSANLPKPPHDEPRQGPARIYVGSGSPAANARSARGATPSLVVPTMAGNARPGAAPKGPPPRLKPLRAPSFIATTSKSGSRQAPVQAESQELDAITESSPSVGSDSQAQSASLPALAPSAKSEPASRQSASERKDRIIVTSGYPRRRIIRSGLLIAGSGVALVVLAWVVFWFWTPIATFFHVAAQGEAPSTPPTVPASVPATGNVIQGQAATVVGTGLLNVESDFPATIYIDGTLVGSSPVQDFSLSAGRHAIRAVVGGDRVRALNVQISAGTVTPVKFAFGP